MRWCHHCFASSVWWRVVLPPSAWGADCRTECHRGYQATTTMVMQPLFQPNLFSPLFSHITNLVICYLMICIHWVYMYICTHTHSRWDMCSDSLAMFEKNMVDLENKMSGSSYICLINLWVKFIKKNEILIHTDVWFSLLSLLF